MAMGTTGNDSNAYHPPGEAHPVVILAPVDDPNVSNAELSEEDRQIRLERVRSRMAFRYETR
jgi:hypothetical protein